MTGQKKGKKNWFKVNTSSREKKILRKTDTQFTQNGELKAEKKESEWKRKRKKKK